MRTLIAVLLAAASLAVQAQERSYAVLSLVADKLLIVEREMSTGSRIDRNTRNFLDMPNAALDRTLLLAAEDALRAADPKANVMLLGARDPKLYEAQTRALEEGSSAMAVYRELGDVLARSKASHVLLLTKHRAPTRVRIDTGSIGSGNLEGVGFYLDPSTRLDLRDRRETSVGFIAPFAYFKASLIDVSSGRVVREETILRSDAIGDQASLTPWKAMTDQQKAQMLQAILRDETRQAVSRLVR